MLSNKGPIEDPRQGDKLRITLTYGPGDTFTTECARRDFSVGPVGVQIVSHRVTNIYPLNRILAIRIVEVSNG